MNNAKNVTSSYLSGSDYGFESRSKGLKFDEIGVEGPPVNVVRMAIEGFRNNFDAIFGKYNNEKDDKIKENQKELQVKLKNLTLNVTGIWEREKNDIEAAWVIKIPYYFLCFLLDSVFEGRYIPARFYLLETVARMPYFSYISMLHLYETLGWWRRSANAKRIHFSQEWNEFHHLLIMESLGGDQEWWGRALAMHSAFAYYWALIFLWLLSPTLAYQFSELLETHAVHTYSQFLDDNQKTLKSMPPPQIAVEYYSLQSSDPLFDELQTASVISKGMEQRRPGSQMTSLYDVFSAIRDDEGDHVNTMNICLDSDIAVSSPSVEKAYIAGATAVSAILLLAKTTEELLPDIELGVSDIATPFLQEAVADIIRIIPFL